MLFCSIRSFSYSGMLFSNMGTSLLLNELDIYKMNLCGSVNIIKNEKINTRSLFACNECEFVFTKK